MKTQILSTYPEEVCHVNGWSAIHKALRRRGWTQTRLAKQLGITPSAVTQIKQGKFLLNAEQLRRTADFLCMDSSGKTEFYRQIFFGRLLEPGNTGGFELSRKDTSQTSFPECSAELLEQYEPLLEDFGDFFRRHGKDSGSVVRIPLPGLPGILLRYREFPRPGDIILLKCRHAHCKLCLLRAILTQGISVAERDAPEEEKFIPFEETVWMRPALPEN